MPDPNTIVKAAIDAAIAERGEIGIQACAYLDGKQVIDTWGGLADETTDRPVDGDTLFPVFSVSKAIVATALHIHAEHGYVEYDAPVAKYWPEFGAHGKEKATVADVLLHRTGVPHLPAGCTPEQMCDWDGMARAIAEMTPLWEPGTRTGYHGFNQGWIIGEIIRRTDPQHRPFGRFVREELCEPLDITDIWFGIPAEAEPRVAKLTDMPPQQGPRFPDAEFRGPQTSVTMGQATWGRPDVRRACIPSVGGIMNARSVARHYAMLVAGGTLDGVRLLSPERIALASSLHDDNTDAILGGVRRRGLGYSLGRQPGSFGHNGIGGGIALCDPQNGFAVCVLHNRLVSGTSPEENPLVGVSSAIRAALGLPE